MQNKYKVSIIDNDLVFLAFFCHFGYFFAILAIFFGFFDHFWVLCEEELIRLDEAYVQNKYKVSIIDNDLVFLAFFCHFGYFLASYFLFLIEKAAS